MSTLNSIFDSTTVRVGPGPFGVLMRALLIMILVVGALVAGVWATKQWYAWTTPQDVDITEPDVDDIPAPLPVDDLVIGERLIVTTPHGEEVLTVKNTEGNAATITDLDGDTFTCAIVSLLSGSPDCAPAVTPGEGVRLVQTDRGPRYMEQDSAPAVEFTCSQPYLTLDQSAWSCDGGTTWNSK